MIVILGFLVINTGFKPYTIPSSSMRPTIPPYAYLPCKSDIIYDSTPDERGDIIAFRKSNDDSVIYLKRIIGVGGDKVQIVHGNVILNDIAVPQINIQIDEISKPEGGLTNANRLRETLPNGKSYEIYSFLDDGPLDNTKTFKIAPREFFVLGDNRDNSLDSRKSVADGGLGMVKIENIVARCR